MTQGSQEQPALPTPNQGNSRDNWLPKRGTTTFPEISQSNADRLTLFFLILGAILYTTRFGLRFPLWWDESFLILNIARRDFWDLLLPLDNHQVAPLLFLLIEKGITQIAGLSEWSLRAFPFCCSLLSLYLFRQITKRTLDRWSYVLAFGIYAVSYWVVRYTSETKPYALDVLVALLFMHLAVAWRENPKRLRHVVALCGLALVAFCFSFPSVFVGGGISLFMLATAWQRRDASAAWQGVAVGVCLCGGFASAYLLQVSHQMTQEASFMQGYWSHAFPPLTKPLELIVWLGKTFTGELMPYPFGGRNAGSALTGLFCLLGVIKLIQTRRFTFWFLLAAPMVIAFVAASLHKYPFGAPTRCQLYLAPAFCILAGMGLAQLLQLISTNKPHHFKRGIQVTLAVLVVIAISILGRDVINQAKSPTDIILRDFARFFWQAGKVSGEHNLCLREDFGTSFTPSKEQQSSELHTYLSNYHLYGKPDPHIKESGPWKGIVRIANFRIKGQVDQARRKIWIREFEEKSGLYYAHSALYKIPLFYKHRYNRKDDVIEIMTFEPYSSDSDPLVGSPTTMR